jgi:uroporphyrinogen-III decarboxylase
MNSRERMCKVLNHEIPDRLPTFEYAIDKKIINAVCPGGTYADVVEALDLDGLTAWEPSSGGYVPGVSDKLKHGDIFVDEWGIKRQSSGEMAGYPLKEDVPIRAESDLQNYIPPDPGLEHRYELLRSYVARFSGKKLVSYFIPDMFDISKYLMGEDEFLIAFSQRPQLVKSLLEMTTDWVIQVAQKAADIGADMIIDGADIAYKNGLWVRPELMEAYFIPCLKRVAEAVKKRRAYVFYHSHGNLWKLLGSLATTGIDVIHPLAYEDGMDIGIVKNVFGKKVAVAGNISTDFMTRGSREEVIALVKETIAKASMGGGHIMMASSSIYSGVNPENYRAMVETVHTFGRYR